MNDLYEIDITPEYVDGIKEWLNDEESWKKFAEEVKAGEYDALFNRIAEELKSLPRLNEEEVKKSDEKYIEFLKGEMNKFKQRYPGYDVDFETFYATLLWHPKGRELLDKYFKDNKRDKQKIISSKLS